MAGPKIRQKLQPRSQQAQINHFQNRMRNEPDFRYQSRSPAGNVYDDRNFNIMNSEGHDYIKTRGTDTVSDSFFENSFLSNPNTGQRFGHSVAYGPKDSWNEGRFIYPDASGFGWRNGEEYDIQLKGPQTWGYDPGNQGLTGTEVAQSQWKQPEKMEKTIQALKLRPQFEGWTDESIKNWIYNQARANRGGIMSL